MRSTQRLQLLACLAAAGRHTQLRHMPGGAAGRVGLGKARGGVHEAGTAIRALLGQNLSGTPFPAPSTGM